MFCDFCLFPEPGEECPSHGPTAVERLRAALLEAVDRELARLEATV